MNGIKKRMATEKKQLPIYYFTFFAVILWYIRFYFYIQGVYFFSGLLSIYCTYESSNVIRRLTLHYFIVLSLKATIKLTTEIFKAYSNHKTSVVAWGICSTPLYNCAGRGPPFPRTVRLKICFSTKFRGSLFSQNRRTMKGLVKYCFVQKIQIFPRILLQLFIFGQMHVIFSFWGLFSRRSNFRGKFSLLP